MNTLIVHQSTHFTLSGMKRLNSWENHNKIILKKLYKVGEMKIWEDFQKFEKTHPHFHFKEYPTKINTFQNNNKIEYSQSFHKKSEIQFISVYRSNSI